MTFNPCFIIPIYNHRDVIAETLASLQQHELPCFIIDDGSDLQTQQLLAELAVAEPLVTVYRLEQNQGKGGAVMKGLRTAHQAGFSHALQIDADGQHNVDDIPYFLQLSEQQQDALICGQPAYDDSVPKGRLIARYITHFWVGVETLTAKPVDTMCGFRVYPLAVINRLIDKVSLGRRMDFDIEVIVRAIWRKVPIVKVETRVIYPESGVSHFNYLRDNVLITKMHTRLVLGMLLRFPMLVYNRVFPRRADQHWSSTSERGMMWGIQFLLWIYQTFGRRIFEVFLFPVIGYFFMTSRQTRAASQSYLQRVYRAGSDHPRMQQSPTLKDSFFHFMEFGRSALDRVSSWLGHIKRGDIDFDNADEFIELARSGRGGVVVGSHLGNIELSRALAGDLDNVRMNALVFTEHAEKFNAVLKKVNSKVTEQLIQVSDIGPDTAILLKEKVDNGELIIILGDRTAVASKGRVNRVEFLGDSAEFGQGPFILASLLECPVYLMFCVKEQGRYRVYFEHFADQIKLKRKTRDSDLQEIIQRYAQRLEYYCLKQPFQWFNFYEYWRLK